MKRSVSILLVLFLAFSASPVSAIPSFGTLMPTAGEGIGGGRADFIFDRDFDEYEDAKAGGYYYQASYGLTDWFSLDGMIGLGSVTAEFESSDKLRYPTNFSGGYGFRLRPYRNEKHGIDWVAGFQHMSTHPGKRRQVKGRKYEIIWDEWQLSSTISKEIWRLRPYCGMKYSFTYLISKVDGDRRRRLSNGSPIGLIVGTDVKVADHVYVNAEGRFFDETALNAGVVIRY